MDNSYNGQVAGLVPPLEQESGLLCGSVSLYLFIEQTVYCVDCKFKSEEHWYPQGRS